jgi:hypothetical protein
MRKPNSGQLKRGTLSAGVYFYSAKVMVRGRREGFSIPCIPFSRGITAINFTVYGPIFNL